MKVNIVSHVPPDILSITLCFFFLACTVGSFGTECSGTCHCADDGPCDVVTGECAQGCADGWMGQACAQEVAVDETG